MSVSPIKRFLVFGGYDHYPSGGWEDFLGSFDTEVEAWKFCATKGSDKQWHQVIDSLDPPDPEDV